MFRIGQAKDIHVFKEGRKLFLCGIEIPYHLGLDGHSDADVALHAVAESILGALALGDLGHFFPNTDERFKNKESSYFVSEAVKMMKEKGYEIGNIDLSITLEEPKLFPYIQKMRENLANLLGVFIDQVSIKAGTNEGVDGVGEKEAIEAFAIVLLYEKK